MSSFRSNLGVLAVLAIVVVASNAAVIINFDTYPNGAAVLPGDILTTQWSSQGVEFSDGAGSGPGPSNNSCSYSPPNHAYAPTIIADFVDPCTGIPSVTDQAGTRQDFCWVPGEGIDMYAYDRDGNLVAHEFNSGGGNLVLFSFPQPVIARLVMFCNLQGIDDFMFNPPQAALRGDMDCNATIDTADVGPFALALTSPVDYGAAFPTCDVRRADMNCDRNMDGLDIQPFVDRLLAP